MTARLQPELRIYGDNRRFATPVSPYRRGFEDCLYDRVYANPYHPGSPEWHAYERGNQDARWPVRTAGLQVTP